MRSYSNKQTANKQARASARRSQVTQTPSHPSPPLSLALRGGGPSPRFRTFLVRLLSALRPPGHEVPPDPGLLCPQRLISFSLPAASCFRSPGPCGLCSLGQVTAARRARSAARLGAGRGGHGPPGLLVGEQAGRWPGLRGLGASWGLWAAEAFLCRAWAPEDAGLTAPLRCARGGRGRAGPGMRSRCPLAPGAPVPRRRPGVPAQPADRREGAEPGTPS